MAYQPNELFATTPGNVVYRVQPEIVQAKTFAPVGGSPILAVLAPLGFETVLKKWVVWSNAGANGSNKIAGFVWPDPVQLDAVNDGLGNVLMRGIVHHDDIPLPVGETQPNLDTALKTGPRALGLTIQGLVGVN